MNRASGGPISGAILVLVCWETRLQRGVGSVLGVWGRGEADGKRLRSDCMDRVFSCILDPKP